MNYKEKLHVIKSFIFDFDGVLSDGGVWGLPNGEFIRRTDVKDGYAIQYAVKKGYSIAVISGSSGESLEARMKTLGVQDVFLSCASKIETYERYLKQQGLKDEEVLYVGDDIPDYEVMKRVGVAVCPADAAKEIRNVSDYISPFPGGKGCVRDIVEQVLRLQGMWFHQDAFEW